METRKAIVTGAFGFIGRNTARFLAASSWEVIGLGHGTWSRQEWETWGLTEWHTCDITLNSLLSYADTPDLIVHCAGSGSVNFSMTYPMQDYQRTVATTLNVLEFMRLYAQNSKLVYPSSAAVYGNADKLPIPESATLKPISPYGVHKMLSEQICRSFARHFGIHVAVVRLFSVYGRGLRKQLLWDACNKISKGDMTFFGTGNEVRDWLHIDDVATLLLCAGAHASPACPIVNGATGYGTSVRDILSEMLRTRRISVEPRFNDLPRPGDPPGYIGDISRAMKWGWKPTVYWKDGVRDYVQWYTEESP